jgi:hypothetical protein
MPLVDCNDHEDHGGNDDQTHALELTTVGQSCIGSLEDDPVGEDGDDYYWFDVVLPLAAEQHITLPGRISGLPVMIAID